MTYRTDSLTTLLAASYRMYSLEPPRQSAHSVIHSDYSRSSNDYEQSKTDALSSICSYVHIYFIYSSNVQGNQKQAKKQFPAIKIGRKSFVRKTLERIIREMKMTQNGWCEWCTFFKGKLHHLNRTYILVFFIIFIEWLLTSQKPFDHSAKRLSANWTLCARSQLDSPFL